MTSSGRGLFGGSRPSRANPWRTVSRREVYRNPWIGVREDAVIRPDGQPGIYGVVETPLAAGVLALTDDEEVVLVGQWRYALEAWSWEIVEGGAGPGESSLSAAKRELREEAGRAAASWAPLGAEVHLSNSFTDERAHIYVARELTEIGAEPDPTEVLEVRIEPFERCLEMLDRGEIQDAITVMALHRWERHCRLGQPALAWQR